MHNTNPVYRPEIDGLRAIAILSVVIYHAFPSQIRGGFVGVDIFFVISGFLISSIIFRSLQRGDFSFTEFYARRICRIFPALILVLTASYSIGWLVLFPVEFKQLGKHMVAGTEFIQNFVLDKEAGYFDTSSELKPLMHLWSLSIEEQFYLVFPLLIWGIWRLGFTALGVVLVLLSLVSFGINIGTIAQDATHVFFMPHTRFWELLTGSMLAYIQLFKAKQVARAMQRFLFNFPIFRSLPTSEHRTAAINNIFAVLGLLLIVATVLGLDNKLYPGAWALFPVFGTLFLILAGPTAWINRQLLASRIIVFIGIISYPLYLWHWPILSFARIMVGKTPSSTIRFAAVVLSFLLAWLTYKMLEKPLRTWNRVWAKSATLCLLIGVVGYVGYNTAQRDGLTFREVAILNQAQGDDGGDGGNSLSDCGIENQSFKMLFKECSKDKRGNVRFALLGDSKAASLYPGLVRTSNDSGRWMIIGGNGPNGAPYPLISDDHELANFQPLINIAVKTIEENKDIDNVVIVTAIRSIFQISDQVKNGSLKTYNYSYLKGLQKTQNYKRNLESFSKTISRFEKANKKVTIVIDNPALPAPEDCATRTTSSKLLNSLLRNETNSNCYVNFNEFNDQIAIYKKLLIEIKSQHPKTVDIFDPTEIYCGDDLGICGPTRNGRPLYAYTDHISDYAAGLVGRELNNYLMKK